MSIHLQFGDYAAAAIAQFFGLQRFPVVKAALKDVNVKS